MTAARGIQLFLPGVAAMVVWAGCGSSPGEHTQEKALAYEQRIGRINKRFTTAAGDPSAMLTQAIAEYRRARPPRSLAHLNGQLIAALQAELQSLRDAAGAASRSDAGALASAQARGAAARGAVGRLLQRLTRFMNACRLNPLHC